ncbi:MAG: hypothetical protein NWE89_03645 [Candidatus Bathyarchaeota archaeon]|nr:hypothetical protein [Candidatus Bathyarchaeota archaeon]
MFTGQDAAAFDAEGPHVRLLEAIHDLGVLDYDIELRQIEQRLLGE